MMDDEMDEMERQERAEREALRQELLKGHRAEEAARKEYESLRDKARLAERKEKDRQKKAGDRIKQLHKVADAAHVKLSDSAGCSRRIVAEFVDRDLIRDRDKRLAAVNRARREFEQAKAIAAEQDHVIAAKSVRMVEGVLRDAKGRPLREKPDPLNPLVPPKAKRGPVRNPRYWRNDAEKAEFEKVKQALDLKADEALVKLQNVQKTYDAAQAKLDAAMEEAFRD